MRRTNALTQETIEKIMENWIRTQRNLLELESQAESAVLADKISSLTGKQCESEGLSILSLEVTGIRNELFGRCCLTLEKIAKLPLHVGFKVGDEVSLVSMVNVNDDKASRKVGNNEQNEPSDLFGLVRHCNQQFIEIVVDDFDDSTLLPPYRLNLRPSMRTHEKMMEALHRIGEVPPPLFSFLHQPTQPDFNYSNYLRQDQIKVNDWINPSLNPSQQAAVECCLNSKLVGVIHGPPGTGKTSTIIELILQSLMRGERLLVCAPSNIAVDTILTRVGITLERLEHSSVKGSLVNLQKLQHQIVRLGHPARISTSILHYTLDYLISVDERTEIVTDVRKEIEEIRKKLYRHGDHKKSSSRKKGFDLVDANNLPTTRKELRKELKTVQKEVNQREKAVVQGILQNAKLVLSTCVGAASHLLQNMEFDMVIIDEAAQGLEAACWIPILLGKRCVLAGDHCQLPPTIKSKDAEVGGLALTLFEQIITNTTKFASVTTLLNIQYRMNDIINQWASTNMYQGAVTSHETVKDHTLLDLVLPPSGIDDEDRGIMEDQPTNSRLTEFIGLPVLMMIDTSNAYMYEEKSVSNNSDQMKHRGSSSTSSTSTSHCNHHEVELLFHQVCYLLQRGVPPSAIGIITPYNGQLELIKSTFAPYFSHSSVPAASTASTTTTSSHNTNSLSNNGRSLPPGITSFDGVEIKTIDGFQGGEKECILLSLVRSNPEHMIGFLGENRRMNVAITRAKRQLTLICDSETCRVNPFIATLIEHIEEYGEVIPVDFYTSEFLVMYTQQLLPATKQSIREMMKGEEIMNEEGSEKYTKRNKGKKTISGETKEKLKKPLRDTSEDMIKEIRLILEKYQKQELKGGDILQKKDGTLLYQHLFPLSPSSTESNSVIKPLHFPTSLSSYLRLQVYEIATELSLFHESRGEEKKRSIFVSLIPFSSEEGDVKDKTEGIKNTEVSEKAILRNESDTLLAQYKGANHSNTEIHNDVPQLMSDANAREEENDGDDDKNESEEEEEIDVPSSVSVQNHQKNETNKSNKKKKKKSGTKAKKANTNPTTATTGATNSSSLMKEMDEDTYLALQIEQNRKLAELHQYRLAARPMPNYEKEYAKDKLKSRLQEKQDSRRIKIDSNNPSSSSNATNHNSSNSNKRTTKVVKKPVPNFGGGKVGGGSGGGGATK